MRPSRHRVVVLILTVAVGAAGCSSSKSDQPVIASVPATGTGGTTLAPPASPTSTTATTAPAPAPAEFTSSISPVSAADVSGSWRAGCPVGPEQLSMVHMSYWGFDNQPHAGTMVIKHSVVPDVLQIFGTLYREHFPILQMQPVDVYRGSDPASMAADNTSGFNCRYAVAAGPSQWSAHAYGEAIDVNPVENPYLEGGAVMPPAGSAFVNRASYRPGMAVAGGQLIAAFAGAGWQWGGRWTASPDYQHFSKTGA